MSISECQYNARSAVRSRSSYLARRADPDAHVAADGSWFELHAEPRVFLKKRHTLRRVLSALVRQRVEHGRTAIAVSDLFEAAWPGERASADAASARVYVAVSTLRRMGLASVLVTSEHGYMFDPECDLVVVDKTAS